jgi:hypothetical protein
VAQLVESFPVTATELVNIGLQVNYQNKCCDINIMYNMHVFTYVMVIVLFLDAFLQGGAQNVIPFYPIKIVTSEYQCCECVSECWSSWGMW